MPDTRVSINTRRLRSMTISPLHQSVILDLSGLKQSG